MISSLDETLRVQQRKRQIKFPALVGFVFWKGVGQLSISKYMTCQAVVSAIERKKAGKRDEVWGQVALVVKNSPANEMWVSGKIPWRRARQPTPVFLSGESHGQRSWQAIVHGIAKSQTDMTE